jgi:CubicO group peptidase (beta-lactamase class C family)
VEGAEQKVDAVHSFMIVRHGHVIAEGWWSPYAAGEPHVLFSLSKSFTSTAVGLAISEGKLSLDDTLLKIFPGEAPAHPSKNLESMRVRDLLRMSTGQRAEDIKDFPFTGNEDLVRTFLEIPVPDIPGTHFVYNTAATYILSAAVQKVTGQTVLDYLQPACSSRSASPSRGGTKAPRGSRFGGFGLNLRTEDIARFGQLYLQKGQWQGRQLIPAAWVEEATSLQTANGSDPTSDWNQGYGYQFWRCRHGFYRGDGAFGQFCIVMPQYDAVLRDHERDQGHAGGHEPGLGQDRAGARRRSAARGSRIRPQACREARDPEPPEAGRPAHVADGGQGRGEALHVPREPCTSSRSP